MVDNNRGRDIADVGILQAPQVSDHTYQALGDLENALKVRVVVPRQDGEGCVV